MNNGWNDTTLGALCDDGMARIQTGPFGSQLHSYEYEPAGVPVVPTEAIGRRLIREGSVPCVSQQTAERLSRHKLKRGDILFARRGVQATGLSAIIERKQEGWLCGTGAILLRLETADVDPTFVSFAFSSDAAISWLKAHAVGAVMPNLNEDVLRRLPLRLPPLAEQRSIASVLGALDEKIELNWRMNETLEALAQRLFKSWFLDATEPALPKGWREGSILESAKLLSGGTPKTDRSDYWDGDILWASAKDVSQCGQAFLIATERTITRKGLQESATQMIPAFCTVVVARGATTGRMVMFRREMAMDQTCYALASTSETPFALYCQLRHGMDDLVHTAHGSVFDTITTSTFAISKAVLPPKEILEKFEEAVSPVFRRILANTEESRTLAALRDALLPKLLSGALRVPQ